MICPYFYIYHDELICRCIQEKSECCAIIEKCENKLAKISYLQDLEKENDKSNRIS